jgi:ankyrin repeat protein
MEINPSFNAVLLWFAAVALAVGGMKWLHWRKDASDRAWARLVSRFESEGETPLHAAVSLALDKGDFTRLQQLLAANLDPNDTGRLGHRLPLEMAIRFIPNLPEERRSWAIRIIKALLDHKANPNGVKGGQTPLGQALDLLNFGGCAGWATEVVNLLIEAGADPDFRNEKGESVLHSENLVPEAIRLITLKGANPNACDKAGNRPLGYGLKSPWPEKTQALLEAGADPNLAVTSLGEMPLGLAKDMETVVLLRNHNGDPNLRDQSGATALLAQLNKGGDPKVLQALLDAGANPDRTDAWGETPLTIAAQQNNAAAIELLLKAGAKEGRFKALRQASERQLAAIDALPETAVVKLLANASKVP